MIRPDPRSMPPSCSVQVALIASRHTRGSRARMGDTAERNDLRGIAPAVGGVP